MTVCPLDSPQLSTTLEEESHRDPTRAAVENPVPPAPRALSQAAPGEEGGSPVWGGERGEPGLGRARSPEGPGAPRQIRDVTPPWTFLRETFDTDIGARRASSRLKKARKARARSRPSRLGVGTEPGFRPAPPALPPPGPRGRDAGRPGRGSGAPAPQGRAREKRGAAPLPWARPDRPGRRLRRGAKCGSDSKPLRGRVSPVRPQPPGAPPRGSRGRGLRLPSPGDPGGLG